MVYFFRALMRNLSNHRRQTQLRYVGARSAIDGRTTNHPNYAVSQRIRKRIEEGFGWMKTVARIRKTMYRGVEKIAMQLNLHAAAYNLVRMRILGVGAT